MRISTINNIFISLLTILLAKFLLVDCHEAHDFKNESSEPSAKCTYSKYATFDTLCYSFCRLPELGARFYFAFNQHVVDMFNQFLNCSVKIFCQLLSHTIQYLYMLSYSFNFLIYYNFISNFRKGFRQILGLKVKPRS